MVDVRLLIDISKRRSGAIFHFSDLMFLRARTVHRLHLPFFDDSAPLNPSNNINETLNAEHEFEEG